MQRRGEPPSILSVTLRTGLGLHRRCWQDILGRQAAEGQIPASTKSLHQFHHRSTAGRTPRGSAPALSWPLRLSTNTARLGFPGAIAHVDHAASHLSLCRAHERKQPHGRSKQTAHQTLQPSNKWSVTPTNILTTNQRASQVGGPQKTVLVVRHDVVSGGMAALQQLHVLEWQNSRKCNHTTNQPTN